MRLIKETRVLSNQPVAEDLYLLRFAFPEISQTVQPGQFINIYFPGRQQLFPRPFSVAGTDGEIIEVLYKKIGVLTEAMTVWKPGDAIRILGALGNAFKTEAGRQVLIAGGVGLAPLMFLNQKLASHPESVYNFIGARSRSQLFQPACMVGEVFTATDDGSDGFPGNIVDCFRQRMKAIKPPYYVYACGPERMLKALWLMAREQKFKLQLSLEKVMACGLGICQGCAIKHANPSEKPLRLVCQDGPVFDAEELDLE